jgi:hypothetical protein
MAYEREVVLNIRHRLEMHEQEQLFNNNVPDNSNDTVATFKESHIHLGSRQRGLRIPTYERVLEVELGMYGFGDSLARFLRDYTRLEVYGSEFEGDGFEGHQLCIYWFKVLLFSSALLHQVLTQRQAFPHYSCKISFDCQETAVWKTEMFHVSPKWRDLGPRHDSVVIQGPMSSSIIFVEVCAMFSTRVADQTFRIIIGRTYKKKGRNKVTGYIELDRAPEATFDFYFLESVIRTVHVLPPTKSNHRYVVQDLYDGDMYLRLT